MRLFVSIALFCSIVFGADADGFRDIKYGTSPINQMVKLSEDSTTNIKQFSLSNEKLNIGQANLDKITYWYFDNKFMGVFINFSGISNFNFLKETLESKYGVPTKPNRYMDNYMWFGGNTRLMINYSSIKNSGVIMLMNDEMVKNSEQYKKSLAAKSVNDL